MGATQSTSWIVHGGEKERVAKRGKRGGGNGNGRGGGEGEGGGKGKVENRIIVQRRPRCRLGADEKEEMKWTVRLTGIYILSCAICVSELCRVTVRRIRSGKSVIITRATLAEASLLFPLTSSSPPILLSPPHFDARLAVSVSHPCTPVSLHPRRSIHRIESLFPPFPPFFAALSARPPICSLVSSGRKLAARALPRAFVPTLDSSPSTSDNAGVCPVAARNARRENAKINNGDPPRVNPPRGGERDSSRSSTKPVYLPSYITCPRSTDARRYASASVRNEICPHLACPPPPPSRSLSVSRALLSS